MDRMSKKRGKSGLKGFIRDLCACWSHHNNSKGKCIFNGNCKVMTGNPCTYFEKSVLGPANYKYRTEGWDYKKLFDEYSGINPSYLSRVFHQTSRFCGCGQPLESKKRLCRLCRRKNRLDAYRRKRQKGNITCATV